MNKREGISFNCEEDASIQTFYVVLCLSCKSGHKRGGKVSLTQSFHMGGKHFKCEAWTSSKS